MPLSIIYATTVEGIFAVNGKLPWTCTPDMKYFRNLTLNSNVVMGRKTAESLSEPLRDRKNFVISSKGYNRDGFYNTTFEEIINMSKTEKVWVIGGAELIKHFFEHHFVDINLVSHTIIGHQYLTEEARKYLHDPTKVLTYNSAGFEDYFRFNEETIRLSEDINLKLIYDSYRLAVIPTLDIDYLTIGRKILNMPIRVGRNGEIRSMFDPDAMITTTFDHGFPILRTKQVWWKGIKAELEFFWDGKTDTKELEAKGIKIWSGNTSEQFLKDNNKTHLVPGQMGPMYGYQWRRFNVPYKGDCRHEGDSVGIDQLQNVIDLIVRDPMSRRIIMTAFNPAQAEEGVLYNCHSVVSHFYVDEHNRINMKTYQRSADWFLGVPFNISSSALLVVKITEAVNKKLGESRYSPGNVTTYFGDAHLYEIHVPVFVAQYVNSLVSNFPYKRVKLDDSHELIDYYPERKFTAPMVV